MATVLLLLTGTGTGSADITGQTVNLSSGGSVDSGHFADVYDLTAGDITLSFIYDATGMVDDAGTHAWAELGVRSNTFGYGPDFNPYWRQVGEEWIYPTASVNLLADQGIDIGDVIVVLDGDHLDVTYHIDGAWCMTRSHFAVATDPADLPQTKKGNAIPGQFPYGALYDPCVTGDVVLAPIPLSGIDGFEDGDSLFFAAHAAVIGATAESAWGEGTGFRGPDWSMYFSMVPTSSPILAAGSGVWLATDYHWGVNTFDPDPVGAPTLDLDDKLLLQRVGGQGEGAYNLPSAPPAAGNNHRFWWDRDGVDPWQNPATANTAGLYQIVITLHATSATTGTAYMQIRSLDQGFEVDGNWSTIELTPAGMTFIGDMTNLVVFYGLYGFGATHTAAFESITVTQVPNP